MISSDRLHSIVTFGGRLLVALSDTEVRELASEALDARKVIRITRPNIALGSEGFVALKRMHERIESEANEEQE